MRLAQNFKRNILSFLPNSGDCREDDLVPKIKRASEYLASRNDPSFEDLILNLVLVKLTKYGENSWGKEEYKKFSQSIQGIGDKQLEIIKGTILNCLCATDMEILAALKKLSEKVDFYPEVERVYIKEKKKYNIQEKEIEVMDCFQVIRILLSKMQSYTYLKAQQLTRTAEDFDGLIESVHEMIDNQTKDGNDDFLKEFDQSFAYVAENPLFRDLYESFRKQYNMFFLKTMYETHMDKCAAQAAIKKREMANYITDGVTKSIKKEANQRR